MDNISIIKVVIILIQIFIEILYYQNIEMMFTTHDSPDLSLEDDSKVSTKGTKYSKLSIFYNIAEEHNGKIGGRRHCENSDRVSIPLIQLKEIFNQNLFPQLDRQTDIDISQLIDTCFDYDIEEMFKAPVIRNCSDCDKKHKLEQCPDCKCKNYMWLVKGDTYITNKTLSCVYENLSIIMNSINTMKKYAYLLIRPPNHHSSTSSSGFCPLNCTFAAAIYAQQKGFTNVLILDWDYHHADGTAKLVNNEMHLISMHAYGYGIYPGSGSERDNKYNVTNIPLNISKPEDKYIYDDDYCLEKFNSIVLPIIDDIQPDMIIISNGLDAHKDDTLAGLNLTNNFYVEATKLLKERQVPLLYILEGGYNPKVITDVSIDIINELLSEEK